MSNTEALEAREPAQSQSENNPYLWPMLRSLPYFRALLRSVEAYFYQQFELPSPVLDLGCGDGHFASVTFRRKLDIGLDPSGASLREAKLWGAYRQLVQAQGDRVPLPSGYFASAISNSVLEHIPDLQAVLTEAARVLQPGAPFLFCVPNHHWPEHLALSRALRGIRSDGLARTYGRMFIRISRHVNMLSPEEWEARLKRAGFHLDTYWHYFSPSALRALEWGHYFGLPSLVARKIFGRWVLVPESWNLGLTYSAIRKHAIAEQDPGGTYTWYVARRQ